MKQEKRLQLNLRVYEEDLEAIERIRRAMSPIPAASEVVRQAIRELDERMAKEGKRRK